MSEESGAIYIVLWDEAAPVEEIECEDGEIEVIYDGPVAFWELGGGGEHYSSGDGKDAP